MLYVIRKPAGVPKYGKYVYLSRNTFSDGAGKTIHNWTYSLSDANMYKTQRGAMRTADKLGMGEVISLGEACEEFQAVLAERRSSPDR